MPICAIANSVRVLMIAVVAMVAANLSAEPTGAPTPVSNLRAYIGTTHVYVTVPTNSLCGTTVFKLDTSIAGGREANAMLLAAVTAGKQISIEVVSCQGWGTPIQSVYVHG